MSAAPKAQSRYRQFRLTATQEISGRFSYSIYAKPLHGAWDEHQCLVRDHVDLTALPLKSTEDVVSALVEILSEQFLPGSHMQS